MSPFTVPPVNVYAGDDVSTEYVFKENNDPLDLSDWTFTAQWRADVDASTALDLDVDDSDAAEGFVRVVISDETSAAMGQNGVWDLEGRRGNDGEEVRTFLVGRTVWRKDVTRA
jgi:hypothetical protein